MSFQANLFEPKNAVPLATVTIPQGKGFGDEPPLISWKGRLFEFVPGSDFGFGASPTPAYLEVIPLVIDGSD